MKTTYHIGILKRKNSIVLQAVTVKDCLSSEINEYLGKWETTKKALRENKRDLLQEFKKQYPYFQFCKRLVIE